MNSFHDHGSWVGPCSNDKHAAVRGGIAPRQRMSASVPAKPEPPMQAHFEHLKLALEMTVQLDGKVLCACCRHDYTVEEKGS